MAIQNWCDASEIHPSQIRVGDIIGTLQPTQLRLTVKLRWSADNSAPVDIFQLRRQRPAAHGHVRGGRVSSQIRQIIMTTP